MSDRTHSFAGSIAAEHIGRYYARFYAWRFI
jgi:hypothetical protein